MLNPVENGLRYLDNILCNAQGDTDTPVGIGGAGFGEWGAGSI